MKNANKLKQIEEKIEELRKQQKQLEDNFIQEISRDIAKILIRKKAFDVDKITFLKKIENIIDELI